MSFPDAVAAIPIVERDGGIFVAGTRIPIDTVVGEFKRGATPEETVMRYSTLKLPDVYAVITYYLQNKPEIEAYLERRAQQAAEVRREVEARQGDMSGLRERLLARLKDREQP